MKYIEPPSTDAAFHFAAEDYCMQHFVVDEPILMIWQADQCVMLGAHQVAHAEVDLGLAEQLGVRIVRRPSGGGTIFTDMGTLLYTVITSFDQGDDAFDIRSRIVAGPIIRALNAMGVPAQLQGRNDILVNGRKVSGLAQRIRKNKLCSHGSLLFDADLSLLSSILIVDPEKIQPKAIASVRSRVGNIKENLNSPISVDVFRSRMKESLFNDHSVHKHVFGTAEIAEIERIRAAKYADDRWTYGKTPPFNYRNQIRFPSGKTEVCLKIAKGLIRSCTIRGDFLSLHPIEELENAFCGVPYRKTEIASILDRIHLDLYLGGVSSQEFMRCIFDFGSAQNEEEPGR
jgi:lipoate-protein ligase A